MLTLHECQRRRVSCGKKYAVDHMLVLVIERLQAALVRHRGKRNGSKYHARWRTDVLADAEPRGGCLLDACTVARVATAAGSPGAVVVTVCSVRPTHCGGLNALSNSDSAMSIASPTLIPSPQPFPLLLARPPRPHPVPPSRTLKLRLAGRRDLNKELEQLSEEENEIDEQVAAAAWSLWRSLLTSSARLRPSVTVDMRSSSPSESR